MLQGTFTAIITPFTQNGENIEIDEPTLRNLVERQIEEGVEGIVPCGTTGESPTLTHEEHDKVIEIVVDQVKGRVKVIAGAGSNSTAEAVRLTKKATQAGVDAILSVNPYYNKPTQEGLYRHFKAVAQSTNLPIVLYNIKGRSGVNIETSTLLRLIDIPNIVAVKEASGDLKQIKEVIEKTPKDFSVLSGDDSIALELIKMGGQGVISVLSNLLPKKMSNMVRAGLSNDEKSEQLNKELSPLMNIEFIETNPIPIKFMMAQKDLCKEIYRLPMCELCQKSKDKVVSVMKNTGEL